MGGRQLGRSEPAFRVASTTALPPPTSIEHGKRPANFIGWLFCCKACAGRIVCWCFTSRPVPVDHLPAVCYSGLVMPCLLTFAMPCLLPTFMFFFQRCGIPIINIVPHAHFINPIDGFYSMVLDCLPHLIFYPSLCLDHRKNTLVDVIPPVFQ